jgi:hypothetical protein
MFPEDRFKIELVGYVEIGGYGLRVTVDHDGLVSGLLDSKQTMHAAIVKFNTLTYTIRA